METDVALLAEGVDRNLLFLLAPIVAGASPSSRRAWIEIVPGSCRGSGSFVALLAEGVDRNIKETFGDVDAYRRPPRGGRG